MWLDKIYELIAVRFIYVFFSRLERLGKLLWPLACVRMKGIYISLVLISLLFGFAGGRPVSPGRASVMFARARIQASTRIHPTEDNL